MNTVRINLLDVKEWKIMKEITLVSDKEVVS